MDVDRILAIAAAAAAADGADPLDEATRLSLRAGGQEAIEARDGFALVGGGALSLVVHPDARGRGTGTALLGQASSSYDGDLTAWSHGNHPAAARLAERHGWDRVRDLWVMRRPSSLPLPPVTPPAGITVRSWRDGDEAALLRVNAAAFAHHPEQGRMDAGDLATRMAEPWFDPAGLLLAVDADDRVLGFHWTKRHSPTLGEVYVVGVDPAAQGRGLGPLLTLAGLHHLVAHGADEVLLYVESDNTPAVTVYSRLGFGHDPVDTHVMYRRR